MTLEGYLLLIGSLMTLLITSRPAMKALREYGTDAARILRAVRRAALADLIEEVHNLTQRFEEHESDADLHPIDAIEEARLRRLEEET